MATAAVAAAAAAIRTTPEAHRVVEPPVVLAPGGTVVRTEAGGSRRTVTPATVDMAAAAAARPRRLTGVRVVMEATVEVELLRLIAQAAVAVAAVGTVAARTDHPADLQDRVRTDRHRALREALTEAVRIL